MYSNALVFMLWNKAAFSSMVLLAPSQRRSSGLSR
nr:MAG TPA: hypothetical protein [Caudoviricetes sp.]